METITKAVKNKMIEHFQDISCSIWLLIALPGYQHISPKEHGSEIFFLGCFFLLNKIKAKYYLLSFLLYNERFLLFDQGH